MKLIWLLIFFGVLIWSGTEPKDSFTWQLEVAQAILAIIILAITYKHFRLTPMLYTLILMYCIVLMIGGHYTYAEVPGFEGFFGSDHNSYDKLGHFFQGFVPALVIREIILRKKILIQSTVWLNFMTLCIILAISAFYELIAWWLALVVPSDTICFLGTESHQWKAQSDIAMAIVGYAVAVILLSKAHSYQIDQIEEF